MFTQLPVYLGMNKDQMIGSAEIVDERFITIRIRDEILISSVQGLIDVNQIRGFIVDLEYIPATIEEAISDAPA